MVNYQTVTKRIFLDVAYFLSCDIIQYQPRSKQNFCHLTFKLVEDLRDKSKDRLRGGDAAVSGLREG